MRVHAAGLTVTIEGTGIVADASLDVGDDEVVGLVGPNGSGKSTVLRCVYRMLRPAAGMVCLDDANVWRLSARESAQRTAIVVQEAPTDFDLTVRQVVLMGRAPHKRLLDRDDRHDHRLVADALQRVIRYQLQMLALVRSLKISTLAALHDLNLAAAYCDRLYVMSGGTVVAHGTPEQVLTPARIREVFEVNAVAGVHPVTGRLQLAFF